MNPYAQNRIGLGTGRRYNDPVLQRQPNQEAYPSAVRWRGAKKPHQGLSSRKTASHRGFTRCKSRTALGLQTVEPKTRVGSRCSNNYLYRGEQFDSDLGLYYLRARYYNPSTGRFLSRDPEDGKPWDLKTLHKYLYVGGDPINAKDPTGRDILFDFGIILDVVAQKTVPALVAMVGSGQAQFMAYVSLYSGYAYLTIPQMESIISEVLVTKGLVRVFACGIAGLMLDRTISPLDPTYEELGSGVLGVAYATACHYATE